MGSSIGRPVCSETQSPASTLLQLPPRSEGNSSRCLRTDLVGAQPICFSTICDGGEMSAEDETRQGRSCSGDRTSMERASLVPTAARDADGQSSPASDVQLDPNEPVGGTSPPGLAGKAPLSHVANFRDSLQVQGVSEQAMEFICASWRKGTEKAYSSAWRRWASWCDERGSDPISAPLNQVLDFLSTEFKKGKEYSTLNPYCSAISSTHAPIDGQPVGKHPIVCRLQQGMFNKRPPLPRYQSV